MSTHGSDSADSSLLSQQFFSIIPIQTTYRIHVFAMFVDSEASQSETVGLGTFELRTPSDSMSGTSLLRCWLRKRYERGKHYIQSLL